MKNRKLIIERETIRELAVQQLSRAAGGVIVPTGQTCYHCTDPWPPPPPPFGGDR